MAKQKKFRVLCPECKKNRVARSENLMNKGLYLCECNSVDYQKFHKENKDRVNSNLVSDWDEFTITIQGNPAVKKNSPKIIKMGKTYSIRTSDIYDEWAAKALFQLEKQKPGFTIDSPVHVEAHFYRNTKVRADLSNLYEGFQDCFTLSGIWVDDMLIESHDGSRKHYDKENPRIEVTVKKYKENI
jgi:Holliday junction resolvase RusA-like endonuclease